jgi:hypothetical protein
MGRRDKPGGDDIRLWLMGAETQTLAPQSARRIYSPVSVETSTRSPGSI